MSVMKFQNSFPASNSDFDARFVALLDAWNAHQDLRFGDADVDSLWASRRRLDAARAALR